MLFHELVASFCQKKKKEKKKQRWQRARDNHSNSGRHIGKSLRTEGKRVNKGGEGCAGSAFCPLGPDPG